MNRRTHYKLLVIFFSYSIIAGAYPYIRFNGNWTNTDFTHLIPQVNYIVQHHAIFGKQVFGNSLFYSASVLQLHLVTGIRITDLLLFAIPFTAGQFAFIVLYAYAREFLSDYLRISLAMALLVSSPLILIVFTAGKHTVFTWSLAFLLLFVVERVTRTNAERFITLGALILIPFVLFHVYISIMIFGLVVGWWFLTRVGVVVGNHDGFSPDSAILLMAIAGSLFWIFYLVNTPNVSSENFFNRLVSAFQIDPQPFTGAPGGTETVPTETSTDTTPSGVGTDIPGTESPGSTTGQHQDQHWVRAKLERFTSLLLFRWEPWWMWILVNIHMLGLLVVGGLFWLRASVRQLLDWPNLSQRYLWVSVFGIGGLLIMFLSFLGYSAQNLLFRFLRYFIPVAVIFIVGEVDVVRWFSTHRKQIVAVALVILLLTIAPVNLSREATDAKHRIHHQEAVPAVDWHRSYGDGELSVGGTIAEINVQQIYQVEFQVYTEPLPITRDMNGRYALDTRWDRVSASPNPTTRTTYPVDITKSSKVYTNRFADVYILPIRTSRGI